MRGVCFGLALTPDRVVTNAPIASSANASADGSGIATALPTLATPMAASDESKAPTLLIEKVPAVLTGPMARKPTWNSSPPPLAPAPGPITVSRMNETTPAALSIDPPSKKVKPAVLRNPP